MTCLRFRKVATKQESPDVVPVAYECWSWVMVDLEGPSTPADFDGCVYTMTYICCVCNGILIEKSSKCNAREARRMFASCIFRSGTIPSMVNSDRGSEFKNVLMQEYSALMGIGRRFSTPWRPMELGKNERVHRENAGVNLSRACSIRSNLYKRKIHSRECAQRLTKY